MAEPTRSNEQTLLCTYLVYAVAPRGMARSEADGLFNDYLHEEGRGVIVHHDHFIGQPGAFAAIEVNTEEQKAKLADLGPLAGWEVRAHPLQFSPTGAGFWTQGDSTLRRFSGMHIEQGEPVARTLAHGYTILPGGTVPERL